MVPAAKILETAQGREGRHHRPVRPDHAVARRDVPRRGRDGAAGLRPAAADRRRDHEPRPHRGEDPSELPARPDGLCQRRQPRGRRRAGAAVGARRSRTMSPTSAPNTPGSPPRMRAPRRTSSGCRSPPRAPTRSKLDWTGTTRRRSRRFLGTRVFEDYPLAELVALHRLDAVLPDLGADGQLSRDPRRREVGEAARALFDDAQAMLEQIVDEKWFKRRARVIGFWPANADGDDIVRLSPTRARSDADRDAAHAAPAAARSARAAPTSRWPTSSRRATAASPITSAASRSPPASARTRSPTASSAPTTTTPRSWSRRWPTASPRPSPSGCTSACARSSGAMRPDETLSNEELIAREVSRHPPGAGLSGAARPHREGDAVRAARRPSAIGVKLTESFAMWPGASVCGLYFSHPREPLFRRRQDRARPGRGLCRAARAGASPRPSAGSRRSSTTTPMRGPARDAAA